jgi:hypothetical protein
VTTTAYDAPPGRLAVREALPAAGAAAAAGVLAGAAAFGHTALGLAVLAVQAVVTLAWLALTDVDGAEGATAIVLAGAVAADLVAVRKEGAAVSGAVAVVALAFVASLAWQLFRPRRERVAESLAGTVSGVVLAVFAAHLLAVAAKTSGGVVAVAVLCPGAALLLGRAGDSLAVRPALATGARRGALGLVAATVAAAVLGAVLGSLWAPLSARSGAAVGVATGLAAVAADLALDLTAADALDPRRAGALRALTLLLPLVVAAPVAYAAVRLLVG